MTSVINICPAMTRLKVSATPRRGISKIVEATKNAPKIPPVQAIIGAFFAEKIFPSEIPVAKMYIKSATVPITNEINAERIGLLTLNANLLLIAACVGIIIPAKIARKM